ncbi:hypothetical protein KY331_04390 [Candidatus Woesearchaeota archaeon]|nr:hypothetical protein [Candidatus Woesearchaeota archaeon]
MKIANSVKINVFVKGEENEGKIKNSLLDFFPFDLKKEKIEIKQSTATGFNEKEIKVFEVLLIKERHINMFLENLKNNLSKETKELILKQAESRTDDECNFFLRFSKDKLINEKELWLTDQGNCFHIKINIAAFPKKKENALRIINLFFNSSMQPMI